MDVTFKRPFLLFTISKVLEGHTGGVLEWTMIVGGFFA
jgi:hypothetical protein